MITPFFTFGGWTDHVQAGRTCIVSLRMIAILEQVSEARHHNHAATVAIHEVLMPKTHRRRNRPRHAGAVPTMSCTGRHWFGIADRRRDRSLAFRKGRNSRGGCERLRVIQPAAGDHDASGKDRRGRSEQLFGHGANDLPSIRFGIVLQQVVRRPDQSSGRILRHSAYGRITAPAYGACQCRQHTTLAQQRGRRHGPLAATWPSVSRRSLACCAGRGVWP